MQKNINNLLQKGYIQITDKKFAVENWLNGINAIKKEIKKTNYD